MRSAGFPVGCGVHATSVRLLSLTLVAVLGHACFGARAELRRRGIAVEQAQLVAHAVGGDAEVVELLLRAELPVDGRDTYGTTPLLAACDSGSVEVVRLLLELDADPNLGPAEPGPAPLAVAAMRGHREVAQLLLAAGAAPEEPDSVQGMTPLMLAALHGHPELVADLLAVGAAVDTRDATSWTALHHAARGGHSGVVSALLAAGADPRVQDGDGRSALSLAKGRGNWSVVDAFEAHIEEEARRRRTSRLTDSPLVIPPGWTVFDEADARSSFWPEHAAFATGQDPPGSRRILLRSPRRERAQIFLILGRLGPWWDHYRKTVQEIESHPGLEERRIQHLTSLDGVRLELRRYRLATGAEPSEQTERVMAFGEAQGSWVVVVDAGGQPEAAGVDRIEAVLRHSRLLEVLGADNRS